MIRFLKILFNLQKGEQDKGRTGNEKSCIWVENGNFYGMGYISNDADINSLEDIKDSLTQYPVSHYIMQLLISFMCRYPKKIVQFKDLPERQCSYIDAQ